ncbi:hypothetical protein [Anaerovibrio lipolyticus]|uniref:hypothetical protein n=1 Tax=Anaerovibrio lipolyticus TaxID=82374 RepID=UPI0023F43815|nr:hypothetical protein [Anaerovibrio lipolyticus]
MAKIVGEYINADDIKRTTLCSDLEAAIKAEELREKMIAERKNFTFETVLSTERNLLLLRNAKAQGYFVRGIYVLTSNVNINEPFRIFKKRKDIFYRWSNKYWSNDDIERLTDVIDFQV